MTGHRGLGLRVLCLTLCLQAALATPIPERDVKDLQDQLAAIHELESTSEARRAGKRLVRTATSLLDRHREADARYRVLALVFEAQQLLYTQRQSEENAEALVSTAKQLGQAPDEHATYRLDADLLLLQLAMEQAGDDAERGMAIASLADRYRGTPAEARSLMAACTLAFNLGHRTLLETFRYALQQGFDPVPEVKAFLQERFASRKPIAVAGHFRGADGQDVSFPKGRVHVLCFWSRNAETLAAVTEEIASLQKRYGDPLKVYSLNLDELPDGGAGFLKQRQLDWIPLMLEGGVDHPFYRALGTRKLAASLVVDPFGYATYLSSQAGQVRSLHSQYEAALRTPDLMGLLRSLLVGDFIMADDVRPKTSAVPETTMAAIKACFVQIPQRFGLSQDAELAMYRKADRLCAETASAHASDETLWAIQSHRMLALMGIWRLSDDLAHLKQATALAESLLDGTVPARGRLVSRYCLAVAALQKDGARPNEICAAFTQQLSGSAHPGLSEIAALLLAIEGHLPDAYAAHRDSFLSRHSNHEDTGWFSSFMLDPRISARLFEAALPDRGKSVAPVSAFRREFAADITTIDGRRMVLPDHSSTHITAVVFLDTPADATARTRQEQALQSVAALAAERPLQDMRLLVLLRDSASPEACTQPLTNTASRDVSILSDTLWDHFSRQYGIYAADTVPNVILLRPDGSVAGAVTGLIYAPRSRVNPLRREIEPMLHAIERPWIAQAIQAKDYRLAVARLQATVPLDYRAKMRHEQNWLVPNRHRRQLTWCYMQLGEWDHALQTINTVIDDRLKHTDYIKSHITSRKWCRLCHGHLNAFAKRILLLEELGRDQDAADARAMFKPTPCPLINDISVLWTAVEEELEGYRERSPRRFRSAEHYLAGLEKQMRHRDYLYNFDIDTDLLTRAQILTKLGRPEEAESDRINARLRAWPHAPRNYDIAFTREDADRRDIQAATLLAEGKAQDALALLNTSVDVHEAGPKLCGFQCRHCGDQRQGLELRAKALRSAGRNEEAVISQEMASALTCPADDTTRDSEWFFPAGRVGWGHVTKGDLDYLDEYLRGGVHAIESRRRIRFELAGHLKLRAQCLEQLGQTAGAARDLKRARALTFLAGNTWRRHDPRRSDPMTLPERYVDILKAEAGE